MRIPKTVSFTNANLYQEMENYAKNRSIDFSQAVAELSEAGLSLFKKAGSLNIENANKIDDLTKTVDHLYGEVEKLWTLVLKEKREKASPPKERKSTGKGRLLRPEQK